MLQIDPVIPEYVLNAIIELSFKLNTVQIEETDKQCRASIYIILSEYNPEWPKWYTEEKERLEQIIVKDNISAIHHYGTPSVHGLFAKPTIDILLEIKEDIDIK